MTKSSLYDLYTTNTDAEKNGVWVPIAGSEFLMARAGGRNTKFKEAARKKFRPFAAAINNNTLADDVAEQLTVDVFVDTILLDWKNVPEPPDPVTKEFDPAKLIPFSKEAAKKLLTELPNLFDELQKQSMDLSNYQQEELGDVAKN